MTTITPVLNAVPAGDGGPLPEPTPSADMRSDFHIKVARKEFANAQGATADILNAGAFSSRLASAGLASITAGIAALGKVTDPPHDIDPNFAIADATAGAEALTKALRSHDTTEVRLSHVDRAYVVLERALENLDG